MHGPITDAPVVRKSLKGKDTKAVASDEGAESIYLDPKDNPPLGHDVIPGDGFGTNGVVVLGDLYGIVRVGTTVVPENNTGTIGTVL